MTFIKICGITNIDDALEAVSLSVGALGFIFAPSLRRIDESAAREIIRHLPSSVWKVGIFVNEELKQVRRIAADCGLDAVQLHGRESPEYCRQIPLWVIKAIGVKGVGSLKEMERYPCASILLDTPGTERAGGTGKTFCWEIALEARKQRNFILSGGLNPVNVYQAVQKVRPSGVDVCSGVEKIPGKKDRSKMIQFVKEVERADESVP